MALGLVQKSSLEILMAKSTKSMTSNSMMTKIIISEEGGNFADKE